MMKKMFLSCLLLVAVNCCTLAQRVVRYVGEAFAFRDSVLDEVALWNGEEAFERMRMKYRFKKVDAGRLKHLYMEREKEKSWLIRSNSQHGILFALRIMWTVFTVIPFTDI